MHYFTSTLKNVIYLLWYILIDLNSVYWTQTVYKKGSEALIILRSFWMQSALSIYLLAFFHRFQPHAMVFIRVVQLSSQVR